MAQVDDRPRLLVIDSDASFRARCAGQLGEEGFQVSVAESSAAAAALLDDCAFDVLLCSAELRSVIESAATEEHPPAVIYTVTGDRSDSRLDALRAGGTSVLVTPVDPGQLSRAVAACMAARRISHEIAPTHREALFQMAAVANSEPSLQQILQQVLAACIGALKADSGSILLAPPPPAARGLTIACSYGLKASGTRGTTAWGEGVAGWVAARGRPIRLTGSLSGYPQFSHLASNPEIAEALLAPIQFRGQSLGVICVNARRPLRFSAGDLALVISAADILAGAVYRDYAERTRQHQDQLAILGRLAASIAHELRNPLAHLKATLSFVSSELAAGAGDNLEVREAFDEMKDGVARMEEMLNHLRASSRKAEPTAELADPNELLRRARALTLPQVKHRASVELELAATPQIRGQPNRILQILMNLIVNAAQAIDSTGRAGRVTLRSRCIDGLVLFEVEDDGPGIDAEIAQHIFQPFFTTKGDGEGTGLGLSISRQIAQEHGGDLTLESVPARGTRFLLRLPAAAQHEERRGRVLLVDDDKQLLKALARCLSGHVEPVCAADAEEALRIAAEQPVDAVVTDFNMPRMHGVALAEELRRRGVTVPIAILSAAPEEAELCAAESTGQIQAVWSKPWSPTTLRSQVIGLLNMAPRNERGTSSDEVERVSAGPLDPPRE